jgi:hypothetical protein
MMDHKTISGYIEAEINALFAEIYSGIAAREDSRAFGAMIEKRITDNWADICQKFGFEPIALQGRRTIFDFACKIDGIIWGFDVKTKDLDSTKYSDGGVCAVGNLLKFLANDNGVFAIVEFGHTLSNAKGGRDIEYIRVAPFHILPEDAFRIENLGTGQVRLNYTLNQVWDEIHWDKTLESFYGIFCSLAITHYKRVKADAEKRIHSIEVFIENGYKNFKFIR